ncbi:ImmA/IrrE family metallo-endopeptidase [Caballeronia sp. 15711]|uniref:ImmA/IrrE family metallo-endopeptidase n=1 Tax=Caballeronia sp. 15711 TaxID=3391029 RepID=UPI0039E23F3B
MADNPRIQRIFGALESAGYPVKFQRSLLPEWVTPDVLADESVSTEVAAILAKRLNLRTSGLFSQNPSVESLHHFDTKYKRSVSAKSKDLTAATSIAVSVAEMVSFACRIPHMQFPGTAAELRAGILKQYPGKYLGLRNLLMATWSRGIPVVFLAELGPDIAKMDGMVVHTDARPVILLSKKSPYWAWQLFILAHEVAHCALGHVAPDEILVDEDLGADSYALADADEDEQAADHFALELLNGRPDAEYSLGSQTANPAELTDSAYQTGVKTQVDPGHIILNLANKSGDWGLGMAALKRFEDGRPPAPDVISQAMWMNLEVDDLPGESLEFLERVTASKFVAA